MWSPLGKATLIFAALLIALAMGAHPACAANASGVPSTGDLSSVFNTAGASTYFNWSAILGFCMYILAPLCGIVACLMIGWTLKDNHNPGAIVGGAMCAAFVIGLVFVCVAIPSQVHANTTGALIATTLIR